MQRKLQLHRVLLQTLLFLCRLGGPDSCLQRCHCNRYHNIHRALDLPRTSRLLHVERSWSYVLQTPYDLADIVHTTVAHLVDSQSRNEFTQAVIICEAAPHDVDRGAYSHLGKQLRIKDVKGSGKQLDGRKVPGIQVHRQWYLPFGWSSHCSVPRPPPRLAHPKLYRASCETVSSFVAVRGRPPLTTREGVVNSLIEWNVYHFHLAFFLDMNRARASRASRAGSASQWNGAILATFQP